MREYLPDMETALKAPAESLCQGTFHLMKSIESSDSSSWRFAGVASDENEDIEGDVILRKALDLSYASTRGYVNWDHSREPADQLGYLSKATIIEGDDRERTQDLLGISISKTASVYIEGQLYKHVPKAVEVHNIMKSVPAGHPGLGLSLDGALARDVNSRGVVKAFVRGVAITAAPVHTNTLSVLKKSLKGYSMMESGKAPADFVGEIATATAERLIKAIDSGELLLKSVGEEEKELDFDEATLWVLKQRPSLSYDLAAKIVRFTQDNLKRD